MADKESWRHFWNEHAAPTILRLHLSSEFRWVVQKVALNDADEKMVKLRGSDPCFRSSKKSAHLGKVYTSKGLRARRLRLSAHTAIQFYDIQDRLGYVRSSEAMDWLIENAKAAIDALSEPSTFAKEVERELTKQSPSRVLGGLNSACDFPAQGLISPSMANSAPSSSSTQFQNFNHSQKVNPYALSPLIFNATPTELSNQETPYPPSSNGFPSFPMWE